MPKTLHLLCAGAAQGLVKALQDRLQAQHDVTLSGRFGAVGAMKEALLAGEPCDLMIVTDKMISELAEAGRLDAASRAPLGRVKTGVAVRAGAPRPDIADADALRAALLASDAIFFPDPQRATAGIHFANVMRELGVHDELQPRFRTFPNGATAMAELAACDAAQPIGCTQVTEINYTAGVDLVEALPDRFELSTLYAAAVSAQAGDPALARRVLDVIAGAQSQALREAGGFIV